MGAAENKALIQRYFDQVTRGDADLPALLADDVTWWVPPGSRMGGLYRGRPEVLAMMQSAVGRYASEPPLRVSVERLVAEGDWVCAQVIVTARTAAGRDYRNHYHFAFEVRDGRIHAIREYVDTQYANDLLL
jgi:ketosteroid isomerase-like protein